MHKLYYLKSCSTCQRIIKELGISSETFDFQNIKEQNLSPQQLDDLKEKTKSYEALFSRKATKYKELGLKDKPLSESDYRNYILEEYTFLKRPVFVINNEVFVGNAKETIAQVAEKLDQN